jgi:hypothetical protein
VITPVASASKPPPIERLPNQQPAPRADVISAGLSRGHTWVFCVRLRQRLDRPIICVCGSKRKAPARAGGLWGLGLLIFETTTHPVTANIMIAERTRFPSTQIKRKRAILLRPRLACAACIGCNSHPSCVPAYCVYPWPSTLNSVAQDWAHSPIFSVDPAMSAIGKCGYFTGATSVANDPNRT